MKKTLIILFILSCKIALIGQVNITFQNKGNDTLIKSNLSVLNLGGKINSENDEMFPRFIQSQNRLYFDYRSNTIDGRVIVTYFTDYSDNGWSKPKPFNPNRVFKDFVEYRILHISEDTNELVVGGRLFGERRNWFLYKVKNHNGKWEIEEKLDWIKTIPSMYSVAFSENLDTLYFSLSLYSESNSLFYRVIDFDSKTYAPSVEIEEISSSKGETIIDFKNDTLWFSSNGFNGIGSYDIYYSVRKDNQWSEPVNLGTPINSTMKEFGYCKVGTKTFIASNREGSLGGYDIFILTDNP